MHIRQYCDRQAADLRIECLVCDGSRKRIYCNLSGGYPLLSKQPLHRDGSDFEHFMASDKQWGKLLMRVGNALCVLVQTD